MAETNKKFNVEMNMIRGIFALLTVLGHVMEPIFREQLIYFIVYINITFFFICGYFMKDGPTIRENMKRRLDRILKPFLRYFVGISLFCGFILILKGDMTFKVLIQSMVSELLRKEFLDTFLPGFYIKTAIHRPLTVTWFFVQLIPATIIAIPILGKCKGSIAKKAIAAIACLLISSILYARYSRMPLQLQLVFFEVAVLIFAHIAHQMGYFTKSFAPDTKTRVALIIVLQASACLLLLGNPNPAWMSHGQLGSYDNVVDVSTSLLQMFCGSISMYEICVLLRKSNSVTKVLNWLGSHTIEFVYMHLVFAWLFTFVGIPIGMDLAHSDLWTGSFSQYATMFIMFVINLILCTTYCLVLDRIKKFRFSGSK